MLTVYILDAKEGWGIDTVIVIARDEDELAQIMQNQNLALDDYRIKSSEQVKAGFIAHIEE